MTDNERLTEVLKITGCKNYKVLSEEIGLSSPQVFYDIKKGIYKISANIARKINQRFPLIDIGFLLGDIVDEEMTLNNDDTEYYQDVVDATEEDLENCNSCQYRIPFIPDSYVRSPEVNIRDLIKTKSSELRHSSLRDIIGDDINYYQRVTTNAMAPDFMPGDILLIKFIPRSNVISGGVYILDSTVKGCMVRQIDFDESTYTLHASNPDYRDLTLSKSDIMSFGRVVCLLRTNFNLSPANISNQSIIKDEELERAIRQNSYDIVKLRAAQ